MNKDQTGGKVKIPSTLTIAFVQYTTEELDQLDQPQHPQTMGQEDEQYPTVPPLVYGITPQESLAGMDRESRKRDSPLLDQTVMRAGDKQDKFVLETDKVHNSFDTVYPEYYGNFGCHSKTKNKNHTD